MKKHIFFFCMLCPLMSFGQIYESFYHRDSLNHLWFGDTAYFFPDAGILHLEGPKSPSTLYYATRNSMCDSVEWNFEIQLGFNPSSSNFVRVYLMSDTDNLKVPLNGYFVQIGQTGGKNNIQFFRQEGTSAALIFTGISTFSSSGGLKLRLRIKRLQNSEWSVFSGDSKDFAMTSEGEPFVDSIFLQTVAFGFYCKYSTTTRNNLYAFGSVKVCTIEPDPVPKPPVFIDQSAVVISEVMFDPSENSAEYLEIMNRSGDSIHLSDLRLGTFDNSGKLSKILVISANSDVMIAPRSYAVLSKNSEILSRSYAVCSSALLAEMPNFPALSNTSGQFALLRKDTTSVDEIYYHTSMHYALLAATKGISLERLNLEKSGIDANNWHSASENADYATPGCPNSQGISTDETADLFQLAPLLISPDNDGRDDILSLSYHLETVGFTGNIRIFNSAGRMVKHLVKSELLSTQGVYYWDGLSEQNAKLPSGIYVAVFDIFSLDGRTVRVKKPFSYR